MTSRSTATRAAPAPTRTAGGRRGTGAYRAFADFEAHARANLLRTSRTAKGVSDTSASADKPKLSAEGEGLKAKTEQNFTAALQKVWAAKDAPLRSPKDVEALVLDLARTVSDGLLQPGQALGRTWETKYKSTHPRDIPTVMQSFYREFYRRLKSGDPIETAAWVEKRHENIHPWADGVGRTTKALAALALLRGGKPLPTYTTREDYYGKIGLDKPEADWMAYYRTLFPKGA